MTVESLRGKLLVAAPTLLAPPFRRAVIAILEHGEGGALGVVVNRPGGTPLADVVPGLAQLGATPDVLFHGGPVEPDAAIALGLAVSGEPGAGWRPVTYPLVTVDLSAEPATLAADLERLRLFAGYAGWSPGQLEGEILTGSWYVVDALPDDPFHPHPERLWSVVLRRQPWPLSAVSTFPADVTLN